MIDPEATKSLCSVWAPEVERRCGQRSALCAKGSRDLSLRLVPKEPTIGRLVIHWLVVIHGFWKRFGPRHSDTQVDGSPRCPVWWHRDTVPSSGITGQSVQLVVHVTELHSEVSLRITLGLQQKATSGHLKRLTVSDSSLLF